MFWFVIGVIVFIAIVKKSQQSEQPKQLEEKEPERWGKVKTVGKEVGKQAIKHGVETLIKSLKK